MSKFQSSIYRQISELDDEYVKAKLQEFLLEDAPDGDLTSMATIDENSICNAYIQAQEDLIFVGSQIISNLFDSKTIISQKFKDGDLVKNGEIITHISGFTREILLKERLMLNLIQRMSAIATATHKFSTIASKYGVHILDTRKTSPGLRLFEKYAVKMGGGSNHRYNLSEAILIKDNHIKAAGSVLDAISSARRTFPDKSVELEVDNIEQIMEVKDNLPNVFLLDNFTRENTIEAVKLVRAFDGGEDVFLESSGGINYSNFENYLDTGIDGISMGALTHSIKASEIHLEFE